MVHISGKYPSRKNCLAIVLPLCKHPTNTNGIVVYDLSIDPEPLLTLSVAEIQHRIFTTTADLSEEGVDRIPLKTVHVNKCPVLAPINVIRPEDAERLGIDLAQCYRNIEKIKPVNGLTEKLVAVLTGDYGEASHNANPDLAIYNGGFFSDADKQKMTKIRQLAVEQLAKHPLDFTDKRLPEMVFRYRARNYPETLSEQEKRQWQNFCKAILTGDLPGASLTLQDFFARLQTLQATDGTNREVLDALHQYATDKAQALGLTEIV